MNATLSVREFVAPREEPLVYPGRRPSYSYLTDGSNIHHTRFEDGDIMRGVVYFGGEWRSLSEVLENLGSGSLIKKYPLLAYGSNASPGQLSYKFKNKTSPVVLVLKGSLMDFDIVYGAKILFGSIPAVLVHSPGTNVECWVTLLDEEQLKVMNESELLGKEYSLGIFESFQTEFGRTMKAYGYTGLMGIYKNKYGKFVALSELKGRNRKYPEQSQIEILQDIMSRDLIWRLISKFNIQDFKGFLAKLRDDVKFKNEINEVLNQSYSSSVELRVQVISSQNLSRLEEFLK